MVDGHDSIHLMELSISKTNYSVTFPVYIASPAHLLPCEGQLPVAEHGNYLAMERNGMAQAGWMAWLFNMAP